MGSLSFALVALVFAQLCTCLAQVNTPIAITNSAPAPTNTCGGCYVVADVAGIQFGQDTITQLQQGTVSVGFNQTKTITSLVGTTEFTIAPTGVIGTGALFNFGTTILYSGVILTSPTAYDVFTAYSVTSTILTNGGCVESAGTPTILSPAFSYARSLGSDEAAEQAFIDHIGGLPTCQPGGVNSVQSTVTPVVIATSFSTITRALPTPQPITIITSTTPFSTTTSTSTTTSSSPTSTSSLSSSLVSFEPLLTSTLSPSSTISSLSSATSPIFLTPLSPVPSPTTKSSPASSQATTTLTSTISVVAIIPIPANTTTLTSTISVGTVVIVGNSTFLPTGYNPSYTIIPVTGQAADRRVDSITLWLPWATAVLSTLVALWAY